MDIKLKYLKIKKTTKKQTNSSKADFCLEVELNFIAVCSKIILCWEN